LFVCLFVCFCYSTCLCCPLELSARLEKKKAEIQQRKYEESLSTENRLEQIRSDIKVLEKTIAERQDAAAARKDEHMATLQRQKEQESLLESLSDEIQRRTAALEQKREDFASWYRSEQVRIEEEEKENRKKVQSSVPSGSGDHHHVAAKRAAPTTTMVFKEPVPAYSAIVDLFDDPTFSS